MVPTRAIDISYLDDTDLAGPLVFALIFGFCLLCTGKVHFGYIYGFGAFGCLSMALVLNLLGDKPIDTWKTCSVLGYCLLPVVVLSAVGIVLDLRGLYGLVLSSAAVCWSCTAATKLFEEYLGMRRQRCDSALLYNRKKPTAAMTDRFKASKDRSVGYTRAHRWSPNSVCVPVIATALTTSALSRLSQ
eukprot:14695-Heterococcus_DN1.PRE.3